jgi:type IV secretion system protein VirD4
MTEKTLMGFELGIKNCIEIIATVDQARLLFLSFSMLCFLCIMIMLFQRDGSQYHSETMKITDTIRTPVPAGQFQNGSARWLNKKEKRTNFESIVLDKSNPVVSRLSSNKSIKSSKLVIAQNAGIVIGMEKHLGKERIQYVGEDEHTLCIGSTLSGKSRGVVL